MFISDGTSKIYVVDGETLKVTDSFTVKDENGKQVKELNELEFARGYIYANIWHTKDIIKIDPVTGKVVNRWNFDNFLNAEKDVQIDELGFNRANVLNGIAYDRYNDVFYLSGKKWKLIYKVKLFD